MKARKELFDKAVKLVSEHPAFSGTKEETLRYVLASEDVLLREVSKGQQVYPAYGVKKAVGLVLTGSCHICKDRKIVETKTDGYIFGVQSLYLSSDCDFSVMAAQDSKIVFIKKPAVDWLLQDDFSAVKSYLEFLSAEINSASEKNDGRKKASAESKLAGYLVSRPHNSKGEVSLPQDMLKLAKQLELDKNTLFKAIEALNAEGAIAFNGSAVCITDEEKLKSFI